MSARSPSGPERTGLIDNRPAWTALPPATMARAIPASGHRTAEFAASITLVNVVRMLARDLGVAATAGAL